MKTTTIYWCYGNPLQIKAKAPTPVLANYFASDKKVHKTPAQDLDYIRCPSFRSAYTNTFALRYIHDYKLEMNNGELSSNDFDQEFYDLHVRVRNLDAHEVSIESPYIFVAEDDDMEMEYRHAAMENNAFNKSAILIIGDVNIGKYVRGTECAFHMRENKMEIKENDVYAYVKFRTDKKIILKQFLWKPEITEPANSAINGITLFRKRIFKPLDWYYKKQQAFKVKERTLKMIKENLL